MSARARAKKKTCTQEEKAVERRSTPPSLFYPNQEPISFSGAPGIVPGVEVAAESPGEGTASQRKEPIIRDPKP